MQTKPISICFIVFLFSMTVVFSCNSNDSLPGVRAKTDTLTDQQMHLPQNALEGLVVANGLTIQSMATEPMLKNPTNIDVDESGRVWVTEAYNYRPGINGNPTNPEGDRIVILEDRDGDGVFDTSKVFYQGPELNAPLGIAVLGNQVFVSQSPYVWIFHDDNKDDISDRKTVLFQGIGGEQHDHGVHSFTFGPDGKLYFTFGNEGKTLKDKLGRVVLDQDGDPIGPKKYKEGMVFRCDIDGTNVECLGDNFRNNFEVAVDSYGSLWQSDNDDDGNKSTRINYVMQYGNYGYKDEMTGAGWQVNRTNIEDSTPLKHWHLNDPGVVPNLLQTGAGSPTGMVIYEGSLLPAVFQNGMIHCDAGPNVVRSYPVKKAGAGFTADSINMVKGSDQWFRPADICVAPDGSLIIADWYDPGVGGHAAGDQQMGRIYRVAPSGSKYTIPVFDYTTPEGCIKALQNPNMAVRHHAWSALQSIGTTAQTQLENLWKTGSNPRMRARAFWVLMKMFKDTIYLEKAIADANPDIRIMGLRAAVQFDRQVIDILNQLKNDSDPQVLRECALALHHNKAALAPALWATLAAKHDGKDRWYLEALGIGADAQWDSFFNAYETAIKDPSQNAGYKDIVWRARTDKAVPYLAQFASQQDVGLKERLRYFRAFDFNKGVAKNSLLLKMISRGDSSLKQNKILLRHLEAGIVKKSGVAQQALKDVIRSLAGTPEYMELVERYEVKTENQALLDISIKKKNESIGRDAARILLKQGGSALAWQVIDSKDTAKRYALLMAMGRVGSKQSLKILETVAFSNRYDMVTRNKAATMIGWSWGGEELVLALLKSGQVSKELIPAMVSGVSGAWRGSVRTEAQSYLPNAPKTAQRAMPTLTELSALKTNGSEGKEVFMRSCATCHQMKGEGFAFGPSLGEIGSKLPKESLLESILRPSAGIAFGYEGWEINMKDGSVKSGIVASKTETDLQLNYPGGSKEDIKMADVKSMKRLKESLMPAGLHQTMKAQELADLLEYLAAAKKNK
ncbi:MAG: PVC-type heme-binding CxxCH protein [Chitinophagaceae bacterium]